MDRFIRIMDDWKLRRANTDMDFSPQSPQRKAMQLSHSGKGVGPKIPINANQYKFLKKQAGDIWSTFIAPVLGPYALLGEGTADSLENLFNMKWQEVDVKNTPKEIYALIKPYLDKIYKIYPQKFGSYNKENYDKDKDAETKTNKEGSSKNKFGLSSVSSSLSDSVIVKDAKNEEEVSRETKKSDISLEKDTQCRDIFIKFFKDKKVNASAVKQKCYNYFRSALNQHCRKVFDDTVNGNTDEKYEKGTMLVYQDKYPYLVAYSDQLYTAVTKVPDKELQYPQNEFYLQNDEYESNEWHVASEEEVQHYVDDADVSYAETDHIQRGDVFYTDTDPQIKVTVTGISATRENKESDYVVTEIDAEVEEPNKDEYEKKFNTEQEFLDFLDQLQPETTEETSKEDIQQPDGLLTEEIKDYYDDNSVGTGVYTVASESEDKKNHYNIGFQVPKTLQFVLKTEVLKEDDEYSFKNESLVYKGTARLWFKDLNGIKNNQVLDLEFMQNLSQEVQNFISSDENVISKAVQIQSPMYGKDGNYKDKQLNRLFEKVLDFADKLRIPEELRSELVPEKYKDKFEQYTIGRSDKAPNYKDYNMSDEDQRNKLYRDVVDWYSKQNNVDPGKVTLDDVSDYLPKKWHDEFNKWLTS